MSHLHIKPHEVYGYREIYYEHMKPMIREGKSQKEIGDRIELIAESYGLSSSRFSELHLFDLLQRIAKERNKCGNVSCIIPGVSSIKVSDEAYRILLDQPELKCPIRSEQKD